MRILHVGKYFPPVRGGMESFLADLVDAQQRAGDDVAVLVHRDRREEIAGDPAWLKRAPVRMKLIFAPISPAFPFWLARAIREHRPDVLHIHMPNVSPLWALLLPAARRIPWVVHWHSDTEPSKHKLSLRLAYPHYAIFERALLEHAQAIVVTSRQYLESSKPLAPWREKCHVVPLGLDPRRLPEITEAQTQDLWRGPGLRILAVGRLAYYKGFETLLRAVIAEEGMQLNLVGAGEERRNLERILEEAARPSRIRLLGEVDDAKLAKLFASCEVFALPSRERTEAFGVVLLEAMRYAKPLVVGDIPGSGVQWVARNGQNAMLVEPENVAAWREALRALAAHPAQRALLGRLGFERYRREFDIDAVARDIRTVYEIATRARPESARALREVELVEAEDVAAPERQGRLLVVIPALNEAACIGDVIDQVHAHGGTDVLVIDDGSTDDTAAIALIRGAKVARAPLWQGAWGAIQTGLRYAVRHGYSGVVTMDGDGQHEPAHLPHLLDAASQGADVVIAACPSRGSRARHVAWAYFKFLTGFNFDDLTSGFRYYNARACRLLAAEEATLLDYQDLGVLLLLRHANLKIAEVAVAMNPRRYGPSRVFSSWWTVARYMAETSLLCLARWNRGPRKS